MHFKTSFETEKIRKNQSILETHRYLTTSPVRQKIDTKVIRQKKSLKSKS